MCRILSHVASENYNANMTNTVSTKAVASMLLLLAKLPYVVLLNILLPIMHALDNLLRRFALQILKRGPIPKHIAIIMDGNRRYARKAGIAKKEAHTLGFQALKDSLNWFSDLGITTVTVYAFSLENFKRNNQEVNDIFDIAKNKFVELLSKEDVIHKNGVAIKVLGDLSRLPDDLRRIMETTVHSTRNNTRATLNVCFAYTSQHEITRAVQEITAAVRAGSIQPNEITQELFENHLYTAGQVKPEIIIRTSGEVRLSDFMLWQGMFSCLVFLRVLWPEFSAWHILASIFRYQQQYSIISKRIALYDNYKTSNAVQKL